MTKKQKENRVSLTEIAVLFYGMQPPQRRLIWELFRLFPYDQIEKIFAVALKGPNEKLSVTVKKKRKYTRKKKASKKSAKL